MTGKRPLIGTGVGIPGVSVRSTDREWVGELLARGKFNERFDERKEVIMKRLARIGLLTLAVGLGVTAVILTTTSFSSVAAAGEIDLTLDAMAPEHVASGSMFEVKIGYYNFGTVVAPDAWVTATLPAGTTFITATDRWREPLPPDATSEDGKVLTWYFDGPLLCWWPDDACCGHILITLQPDEGLDGASLTTTATIATSGEESDEDNNTTSVTSVVCDMAGSIKQVQAGRAMPGDVLTYTITINLARGADERQVTLTDTLPLHQVHFLGWSIPLAGAEIDGQTLIWEGPVQAEQPLVLQYLLGIDVLTPDTVISNAARLLWGGGSNNLSLGPVTTVVTLPQDMLAVGPYQGGQLHHQYGVTLTVPPGAVTGTTRFQFRPLFTDTQPLPPGGLLWANRAFEMTGYRWGEEVSQFNRPLTITMNYTDAVGLKRETVRMWTRTVPEGPWAVLGEPARVMSGTLTFTTTHFTQFALFGEAKYKVYLPLTLR